MGQERAIHVADNDSETRRLAAKLAKLASATEVVSPKGRPLRADSPSSLVAALLTEIDETILARTLEFTSASGAVLSVDVFSRRLLRVNAPVPRGAPKGFEGQVLTDADPRKIGGLLRVFKAFADKDHVAYVKSRPVSKPVEASDYGLAAMILGGLWEMPLQGGTPTTAKARMQAFYDGCEGKAEGWILLKDAAPVVAAGDDGALDRLGAYAEAALEPLVAAKAVARTPAANPAFVLLGTDGPDGLSVMLATEEDHAVLAVIPAAKLDEMSALWRGIFV